MSDTPGIGPIATEIEDSGQGDGAGVRLESNEIQAASSQSKLAIRFRAPM